MARHHHGIGLALGGGGARGFAHVGVLEVLHAKGLPVAGIAGTSSGAIAGAGYALGFTPSQMRQRVMEFAASPLAQDPRLKALVKESEENVCRSLGDRVGRIFCRGQMFKDLLLGGSVLGADFFKSMVSFFLPDTDVESAAIPLSVVATDINSGQPVVFTSGSLRKAVLASSAVPGVSPPVEYEGRRLVDGGVAALVPVLEAKALGGHPVLAVNVDRHIASDIPPFQALEVYMRAGDIQAARLTELLLAAADMVLRPQVGHVHWVDFSKAGLVMDLGHQAALEAWGQIERLNNPGWAAKARRAGLSWLGMK